MGHFPKANHGKVGLGRRQVLGNASVAMLGPNLILFNYKVGINVVSCLLDFKTMHLFVKPNVVKQLGWVVRKVVKPIQVQLAKGDVNLVHVVALGANLKCAELSLNFTMCNLDNFNAILNITFIDSY